MGMLQKLVDGKEPFATGNGPRKTRDGIERKASGQLLDDFPWLADTQRIHEFLREQFPLLGECTNRASGCYCRACSQTKVAAKWIIVIRRYFVFSTAASKIEAEHRWKSGTVDSTAQKIRWVLAGLRKDGKPKSNRKPGRPKGSKKKIADSSIKQPKELKCYWTEAG